ncbi:MAG: hypothetical protein AB7I27_10595 [Bacteriovoracaceae bacterium]
MKTLSLKFLTLVMMISIVSACGKRPNIVSGMKVTATTVDSSVMLSVLADINLGSMSFPYATLPVFHPKTGAQLGTVELLNSMGKNQLKLNFNVSELADVRAELATLPNGNTVPLIGTAPTIVIPLSNKAELYLAISDTVTAIGVAIPIKNFDNIGRSVGGLNFFPTFVMDKAIGAAGIFTSQTAGQNGFAFVADVSAYMPKSQSLAVSGDDVSLNYNQQIPSQSQESKINSMIYQLNQNQTKLQLNH